MQDAWRAIGVTTLGQRPPGRMDPIADLRFFQGMSNTVVHAGVVVATGNPDLEKTIHNERMKLDANFLNSLAIWFAGAGSAGGLISTFVSPSHNFAGAGEVAVIGLILAVVLKFLANRTIGKLR